MTFLPVDPKLGIAAFDVSHRECYAAIAAAVRADDASFPAALEQLLTRLGQAFRVEEEWMEENEHGALLPHREQHARVLAALHHVQAAVLQGDVAIGRHAADDLLPKWLAMHIDTMDAVLALALHSDERRHPPSGRRAEGLPV